MNAMTDDDFAIKLGNRIRELRKIKGVSQLELAYDMDMSMNTISGIELGKISPKIETLRKIAEKLNVSMSELFEFSKILPQDKITRKKSKKSPINSNLMTKSSLNWLTKRLIFFSKPPKNNRRALFFPYCHFRSASIHYPTFPVIVRLDRAIPSSCHYPADFIIVIIQHYLSPVIIWHSLSLSLSGLAG